MSDLIEKRVAIELIHNLYPGPPIMRWNRKRWKEKYKPYIETEKALEMLPSVQLEPLTDKEQRIFLAAMRREEEMCKQVDDECRDCKKLYENSLVRTCHEITRKVKGALWMIQSTGKLQ